MNTLTKRILGMVGAVVVVVGGIALYKYETIRTLQQKMAGMKFPPAVVSTTIAAKTVWQRELHSVGSLAAIQGVTVSNELAGKVVGIVFESGQRVRKGDLLVQLDVSTDEAQLQGLEAQAVLAKITLERARQLREANTNSQADLDAAEAQYREAIAGADNVRAGIAKKTIRAPFSGLLGIRQVDLGQFLPAGGTIADLQTLDPIYVDFTLPQQALADLHVGQAVRMTVDAYPGAVFAGEINARNSRVDEATRNISVQATVRNADERLVPGMFAGVDVILPVRDEFITLPQTAIVYNPYGDAVYVVEKTEGGLVARQHFVTLGDTRGDFVSVLKGIAAGDEVITAGQIKLRNGSPVQVNNTVTLPASATPTPPNT
jgi:membrane fusion protein (multidrug efflux system)